MTKYYTVDEMTIARTERNVARANVAALIAALKNMLNIFDRDLPIGTPGRKACDEARAAIRKSKGK